MSLSEGKSPARGAVNFDFIVGEWRVRNLRLASIRGQEKATDAWSEFESSVTARVALGGTGVVETYAFPDFPGRGEFHGFILRLYDSATDVWRVWWTSSASGGLLGPPVVGGFVDGDGVFAGEDLYEGEPVLVRTRYSEITPSSFRWTQSFSFDGGATYHSDWIMEFSRRGTV